MNTTVPTALVKFSVEMANARPAWFTPSEASQEVVQIADRARIQGRAGCPDAGVCDGAPALVDELADGQVEADLVLETDERARPMERKRGALVVA